MAKGDAVGLSLCEQPRIEGTWGCPSAALAATECLPPGL